MCLSNHSENLSSRRTQGAGWAQVGPVGLPLWHDEGGDLSGLGQNGEVLRV